MSDLIKIKYSNIGDFTCDNMCLSGKLYIEYSIDNVCHYRSNHIKNSGLNIIGLFSDDI